MNRLRMALAGIVLACCAVYGVIAVTRHGEPDRARIINVVGEDGSDLLHYAIWQVDDAGDASRFQTIQFHADTARYRIDAAPDASPEAPGVRLPEADGPAGGVLRAERWWPWALFFIAAGGFMLWHHRPRSHGRVVAVRVRHSARSTGRRG